MVSSERPTCHSSVWLAFGSFNVEEMFDMTNNLFLAITAVIGSGLLAVAKAGTDQMIWAQALIYVGCGSMFLASLVLLNSGGKPRAALIQGLCPLLAVAYTWASS